MHKKFVDKLVNEYQFESVGEYTIRDKSRRGTKIHLDRAHEVEGYTGIYVLVLHTKGGTKVVKIGESLNLGRRLDNNFTVTTENRVQHQPTNIRVSTFLQNILGNEGAQVEVLVHRIPLQSVNIFESIIQTSYHKQGEEVLIRQFADMYRELPVLNPTMR